MHELSIAASVVEIACRHAGGRRITKVELKVGYLRQVVPSALAFSFELVAQGTPAEGAELVLESVPVTGVCRRCGVESRPEGFPLQCHGCGGFDLRILTGEELDVESLDVEEVDIGAHSDEDIGGGGRAGRERRAGAGQSREVRSGGNVCHQHDELARSRQDHAPGAHAGALE